ncbi:MAG: UDP-N-acetylglucosamine 2-epimerase (non-hydrolyzing), partial [Hyphomonadaceae bacterium]|nr:UDP-N-acetylglucosamine 2-epimerase (non-hydrolyzing) [Clostridia bacterium]
KELEKYEDIQSIVCVTAQHREMLDQVLSIFDITPHYDLDIMQARQTLFDITSRVLLGLGKVIAEVKPDITLVHGDTSTTFVGALASFYNQVKVGHVEAGLRTYDKYSPFPEEMNRKLTGTIADFHFSPTKANRENLLREGVDPSHIFITGNTVIDALNTTVQENYVFKNEVLSKLDFDKSRVILMTAHRRENLGEPLENICEAVLKIANTYPDVTVVYPVHPNPLVKETAHRILGGHARIFLIDPIEVQELHNAISRAFLILTDSGGLQEEAPSLGKPVLVLRKETERPEAVDAGTVKIAGVDKDEIFALTAELLDNPQAYQAMAKAVNPYGDGTASYRTVQAIRFAFGLRKDREADYLV